MLRWHLSTNEVNLWVPSAANFRALQAGELFLFKLYAPRNVIVGGGIFAYANALVDHVQQDPDVSQMILY